MNPSSRQERALQLVDQLRAELTNGNLSNAISQTETLLQQVQEWQKQDLIQQARTWLDEALQADVLTFHAEEAQRQLAAWAKATSDEHPEVAHYRQRIEKQASQRLSALQVRGVIAACEELFSRAQTLLQSNEPPHPDFVLVQYYEKALDIATAAQAEHKNTPELEMLIQKAQRLHDHLESAAVVYELALEQQKFTNALHNLTSLPPEAKIPRFTAAEDALGNVRLTFHGMVSSQEARNEIEKLARTYATTTLQNAMNAAQQQLDNHQPQLAVTALEISDTLVRFLEADRQTKFTQLQQQAKTAAQAHEQAEQHAQNALKLAADNPLKAWEEYSTAQRLYEWAASVPAARENALTALQNQLKTMIQQAETAFNQRLMQRVQQLHHTAQTQYRGKDESLTPLIASLSEFNDMTKRYEEYVSSATQRLAEVKDLLWKDTAIANDLLQQVEAYPPLVLEAFPEISELRHRLNVRLSADYDYARWYTFMQSDDLEMVRQMINEANGGITQFPDDPRFPQLVKALQFHAGYLAAQQQFQAGKLEKAQQFLAPLLTGGNGHRDYEAALRLAALIREQAAGSS